MYLPLINQLIQPLTGASFPQRLIRVLIWGAIACLSVQTGVAQQSQAAGGPQNNPNPNAGPTYEGSILVENALWSGNEAWFEIYPVSVQKKDGTIVDSLKIYPIRLANPFPLNPSQKRELNRGINQRRLKNRSKAKDNGTKENKESLTIGYKVYIPTPEKYPIRIVIRVIGCQVYIYSNEKFIRSFDFCGTSWDECCKIPPSASEIK